MANLKTFSDLGLIPTLIQSLDENNIKNPTEIQQEVIPLILTKKNNILGISQTGTGKTAAYGLPLLQLLNPQNQQTQLIIVVPTRELSQQIAQELFKLSRYIIRIRTEAVFGGTKIENQIEKLETPKHIIVATPGRLLDLLNRKAISLNDLKYLVFDEADEMLNMGFKAEIDGILKRCDASVRKLLFTSTLAPEIKKIVTNYFGNDLLEIQIKPTELVNKNIEHQYISFKYGYKLQYLVKYLSTQTENRGILFCRTQAAVKLLQQQLKGENIVAGALYGDLNQYERTKVTNAFKAKRIHILIATDIAARGLDVNDVHFVIHYHLPDNNAQLVNRSGRTARAGANGSSIYLLQEDEIESIADFKSSLNLTINKLQLNVNIDTTPAINIQLQINLGLRQGFNVASFTRFLIEETGVKEDALSNIELFLTHTTFDISSKHVNQLINNLHNTKHFSQKVTVVKTNK